MVGCTTLLAARRSPLATLAAIVPRDDQTECDVKSAEAGAEKKVTDAERNESRANAEDHEADAEDGDYADGKSAAADKCRSVKQQPHRRQRLVASAAHHRRGEDRADNHRREVADEETTRRSGGEERSRALCLPHHGEGADAAGHDCFPQ